MKWQDADKYQTYRIYSDLSTVLSGIYMSLSLKLFITLALSLPSTQLITRHNPVQRHLTNVAISFQEVSHQRRCRSPDESLFKTSEEERKINV